MKTLKQVSLISLVLFIFTSNSTYAGVGFKVSEEQVYTLYRGSVTSKQSRIHVATFDADEESSYNNENCEIAKELFQNQTGVMVKYWCEKGYYNK